MDTPIEDSNLAHIGSKEDKAARKAAAETEVNWDIAGKSEGIQIWRVENVRDEHGNPKFGINPWPENRYGEFYAGDSYIVLQTTKEEDSGSFVYDIYFWIGSESSQDEYGVAAYKANELDDLLDDVPVQHREVQFHESDSFLKCFQNKIKYLDGGIDGGFRDVDESSNDISIPTRMYHVRRDNRITRCIQVAAKCDSLNQGDAFILQTNSVVYTWFGDVCSPFEKNKAAEVAHNMVSALNGQAKLVEEVGDDEDDFWGAVGGKGDIKAAEEYSPAGFGEKTETKMFVLSDVDSILKVQEVEANTSSLVSNDVCLIDTGVVIFVWIGSGSTEREQSQAMVLTQKHIKALGREGKTNVVRVKEGQEARVSGFEGAF
eukprot:CAMPEP_0203659352 /NCGR_PEP_ID=MMETSP0088-20131115/51566_1 /ASSEMBLY_ACC=CAM_ASM_001087 /TAXON_ID=426623 /ORGANISM="Chaetoceros affinis, Strain CCMP159" /LENGTH=373 /DNA_ID=CAMNT_0050521349 /DNA_START=181 /DNA_END=1302 /DNA_ORIENTATION=+